MIYIGLILLGIYCAVVFVLWLGQRRLLYVTDTRQTPPSELGLNGVTEQIVATPDGQRLVTWRAKAAPGRRTFLCFHGNSGTLAMRAERVRMFVNDGYGFLIMAYRGYSGSTGKPTEKRNEADALLVYDLLRRDGVAASDIVLLGESLGSGVAVKVAAQRPVAGVVLDAPFTSITELAAAIYPLLPVRQLILDPYESDRLIGRINAPLLILHGALDRVVPVSMGRRLFGLAKEPKQIRIYPSGHHSDLFSDHGAYADVRRWEATLHRTGNAERSETTDGLNPTSP
jgi:fermentation-respiration switch protein FrsA (DUF1100 family)